MSSTVQTSTFGWTILFLSWLMASIATLGSLYFSEVMQFPPCVLCWYQRVCLFPLVIIIPAGLFPFDKGIVRYALPLTLAGWLTTAYHNLLYTGVIPKSLQPCSKGVSCTEDYITLFGFLTIPLLSLLTFSFVAALLLLLITKRRSV